MQVSIIIPCYRQGRFLATAIDSCLAQTYKRIEIIVVNDGSDDNTDEVARSYGGRIQYIRKPNGGLSSARNAGISAASGTYMKFLDSDDYLLPTQVEWQMQSIGGRDDKVSFTALREFQDGRPERYRELIPRFRSLLPDLLNDHEGAPHAGLFPAKLVRAVGGFSPAYAATQDWDFVCRLGRLRPEVDCDPRAGGYYRKHPGTLSTQRGVFALEVARQLVAMHDEFRNGPGRAWLGKELLGAEQRTYRRMLVGGHRHSELEHQLLIRIRELWRLAGPPPGLSTKFLAVQAILGYPIAERMYAGYARHARTRAVGCG